MSEANEACTMVGRISRGDLYRETLLIRGLLKIATEYAEGSDIPDNGFFDLLIVAERMADTLSDQVSP